MPDIIVSRNTIKLASAASSADGYYTGYTIVLSRYNSITGKELVQKKQIIAYDGANRVATIDGIWDSNFIPTTTDTYKIIPTYPDSRVTINPAMQTMDYITSVRYGKGLDPFKDLYLPSWLEAARTCDAQSDVTVLAEVLGVTPSIGAVYRYPETGNILFQGTVKSVSGKYVRFTNVIGKLTNKWNSWKTYKVNELVYDENNLYFAASTGTKPVRPTHTSGTANGLSFQGDPPLFKVSGTGDAVIALAKRIGNPVQSVNARGLKTSGYSLYDSDGVDYWRYMGWDEHSQRYVTRHQTNLVIDTSASLFDNTNSLLEHFGGIMRYTAGKYHLEVEQGEGSIPNTSTEPRNITSDDIMGKIRVSDEGIRSSYNSLTVAYADPANKFDAKNISFFNSEFLKSDRMVPKKGNVAIPGITNYYNARLLADKFLVKSRFGLTVSFNMAPKGILLMAGRVIQLQNSRYGWINKKFRIENLTQNADTSVDIVAKEYDNSFYVISNISRPPAAALAAEANTTTDIAPGGLRATNIDSQDEAVAGIELTWVNSPRADSTVTTELYASYQPKLFITIASITGGTLLNTATPHNLTVGSTITSQAGINGFTYNKSYFVKTTPTANSFTLAETPTDLPINTFENGTGLTLQMLTASIITTVSPPTTSYIDVVPGEGSERVHKYYWIRHKITQI